MSDDNPAKQLELYVMVPVRFRLTDIIKIDSMNEYETRQFILSHLKNAQAPANLFTNEAIELIACYPRGNRRGIMNTDTVTLEKTYFHNEKNEIAKTIYNSNWFNESE